MFLLVFQCDKCFCCKHTHIHNHFSPTSIILFCANFYCCCSAVAAFVVAAVIIIIDCFCYSFQFSQLQSLIWIAMSIMAILAYFCVFNFRGMIASLGTLTELTLFRMYFHGELLKSNLIKCPSLLLCMKVRSVHDLNAPRMQRNCLTHLFSRLFAICRNVRSIGDAKHRLCAD